MLIRILEPEVMDTPEDARDYDAMDHSAVNRAFVADFLLAFPNGSGRILDVGTGTARIPIELAKQSPHVQIVAIDLAEEMLILARKNVSEAGFGEPIRIERANGRNLEYATASFAAVVSNSIVHHIPDPFDCLAEIVRVCAPGGQIFVRDLLRPKTSEELQHLVRTYAAGANPQQRQLFSQSLHAALTLEEVQALVGRLGFGYECVRRTSDRHWTFNAWKV